MLKKIYRLFLKFFYKKRPKTKEAQPINDINKIFLNIGLKSRFLKFIKPKKRKSLKFTIERVNYLK